MRLTLGWLLLVLAVVGCGAKVDIGGDPVVEEERFINGKPVAAYYQQFHYKKAEGEDLPYHYLSNSYTKLKAIDTKKSLYFTASLFLFEGGEYAIDYEEAVGEKSDDGFITMTSVFKTRLRGTWRIEELGLVLEGLGRGAGFTYNDKDAFWFKFERALNAPELAEKSDNFYYTSSNQGFDEP